MRSLDPRSTALVLIDLQAGIVAGELAPRSGEQVVSLVLVHVDFGPGTMPSQEVDQPRLPSEGTPPGFSDLSPGLRGDGDVVVLKHHWGAFTGTDLDLQLRRRGVKTIVLAGIATNFGVESTARSAWELSYNVVIVEDACASRSDEQHQFAVKNILPQIARVVPAEDIAFDNV